MQDLLEDIRESISTISKTLIRQEVQLTEHIRRTDVAEKNIEKIADTIKPIQEHVAMVKGGMKFIGILGALLAGIAAIWQTITSL